MSKKALSFLMAVFLTTSILLLTVCHAAAVTEPPTVMTEPLSESGSGENGGTTSPSGVTDASAAFSTVPETTVSAAEYPVLTVSAISNYFGRIDAEYNEFTREITVVYMMKSSRRLLSVDWTLNYDAELLTVDPEKNTRESICPLMKDDSVMSVDAEQGVIRFSATDLSMFDFSTAAAPFVQIIFDVRELSPEDSEITKVDLSVNDLLVSEPNPVSGESLPERETVLVANGKVLKNNLTKAVQVSKYTTITPSNFVEPKPATPDEALTTIVPVSQQPTTFVKPTAAADKKKTTEAEEGQPLLYTGTWLVALCILLLLMICSTVLLILRKRDIYNN